MSTFRTVRILRTLTLSIIVSGIAQADIINTTDGPIAVTDVVTPIGSLFQYDYTVADGTGLLAVLDIAVTPNVPLSGLTAPGGSSAFTSTIDTVGSGSGEQEFVSFLENNAMFSSSPESGFIFDSPVGPSASTFDVTLFDSTTGTGGGITAPIVTPEPSYLPVGALALSALLFWRKRLLASRP
jgi:hypothetical protein